MHTSIKPPETVQENELLKCALEYARRGWPVFPLHAPDADGNCSCHTDCGKNKGKHPRTMNGFKDATKDEGKIRRWWDMWPDANIGVRTGVESNIVVLDVDPRNGGSESLAAMEFENGKLHETLTSNTGGDGRHFLFIRPEAKLNKEAGEGLDIKGDGGYIVAPPSLHASGKRYEWANGAEVAPMSEWLLEKATARKKPSNVIVGDFGSTDFSAWEPLHAELRRRFLAHESINFSSDGQWAQARGLCHDGKGDTALYLNLANGAYGCHKGCDSARIREAFGLPERPDESFDLLTSSTSYFVDNSAAWPTLNREKVLYGLAGEIVKTIEPHTEADTAALLLQFLTAFGNIVGRAAPFITDGAAQYPNLFTVIAGGTSAGKGTAWAHVRNIFKDVEPEWANKRVQSGLSSGEGLIKAVCTEDSYSNDKRLLAVETEFSTVLSMNKREGNTLSGIVRGMWDEGRASTMTKHNPLSATDAHVSIIGHITPEELKARLGNTELYNGFANRFLWAFVRRSKSLPRGGKVPAAEIAKLCERLKDAVTFARQQVTAMERDERAEDLWASVYDKLTEERYGAFGKATTRARPQVVRLSCIYALLDMSQTVRREHLEAALAVWQFCEDSARCLFGDSTGNARADKILGALRSVGASGIARADITREVFKNNISAIELTEALSLLQRLKIAFPKLEGRGRTETERWYISGVEILMKDETDESNEVNELSVAA